MAKPQRYRPVPRWLRGSMPSPHKDFVEPEEMEPSTSEFQTPREDPYEPDRHGPITHIDSGNSVYDADLDPRDHDVVSRRTIQGRLFNLRDVPRARSDEQTQEEFNRDPRTWWHGRTEPKPEHGSTLWQVKQHSFENNQEEDRYGGTRHPPGSVHFGTFGAAEQASNRGDDRIHRFYAGRIDTPMENSPQNPRSDPGSNWLSHGDKKGVYYRNNVEDAGSISAEIPSARNFHSWRSAIASANRRGQHVRPAAQFEYERTGGARGPHYDPSLSMSTQVFNPDEHKDEAYQQRLPGTTNDFDSNRIKIKGYPVKSPYGQPVKLHSQWEEEHPHARPSTGGYGGGEGTMPDPHAMSYAALHTHLAQHHNQPNLELSHSAMVYLHNENHAGGKGYNGSELNHNHEGGGISGIDAPPPHHSYKVTQEGDEPEHFPKWPHGQEDVASHLKMLHDTVGGASPNPEELHRMLHSGARGGITQLHPHSHGAPAFSDGISQTPSEHISAFNDPSKMVNPFNGMSHVGQAGHMVNAHHIADAPTLPPRVLAGLHHSDHQANPDVDHAHASSQLTMDPSTHSGLKYPYARQMGKQELFGHIAAEHYFTAGQGVSRQQLADIHRTDHHQGNVGPTQPLQHEHVNVHPDSGFEEGQEKVTTVGTMKSDTRMSKDELAEHMSVHHGDPNTLSMTHMLKTHAGGHSTGMGYAGQSLNHLHKGGKSYADVAGIKPNGGNV